MKRRRRSYHKQRKPAHEGRITLTGILLWIGECALAFSIGCVLVFYFMISIVCVGQAMEPSINSGDRVLVNRFNYLISSPKTGDVVVFRPHGNENAHYYMRRVIGVPGDTVQIRNGFVYVNDALFGTGIGNEKMDYSGLAEEPLTLEKDEFFVLGDNRQASEDSRNDDIGNVNRNDIYGKAWFIGSPWENFGFVEKIKK